MCERPRFLLLQVRNSDDPMREQERTCFATAIGCPASSIEIHDLLSGRPGPRQLDGIDIVLLGGSGDYSVSEGGDWLPGALDAMRDLRDHGTPTFASCWGFQAMVRALGGEVVKDLDRAEVGINPVRLTDAGADDPVFGGLGRTFRAAMGHADIVDRLPEGATLLASTDGVENQAFRLDGLPIYATQFHPELTRATLLDRLRIYPQYVFDIAGVTYEQFEKDCPEVSATDGILARFVREVLGGRAG